MKKIFQVLFAFALLSVATVNAQDADAPNALSIRANYFNHIFPIDNNFIWDDGNFGGLEIEYTRHLNDFLNLSIPIKLGTADYPVDEEGTATEDGAYLGIDALLELKYYRDNNFFYPYLLAGLGTNYEDLDDFGVDVPLGLGLNFRLARNFYLSTKGEYRIALNDDDDMPRDNIQLGAGIRMILGGEAEPVIIDTDMDGVPDEQDLCPTTAGVMELSGCPDADGDGVTDGDDKCPNTPGLVEMMGCPDTDGDGIADVDDECPNESGIARLNGCPEPVIVDTDGDGVPDDRDECINAAGTMALNGCPDRDGDGVADKNDRCPDAAGTAATNGCPDTDGDGVVDADDDCRTEPGTIANNGCPEITEEDEERLSLAAQSVNFETNSARLTPESREILNEVATLLQRYSTYNVRIEGHTDNTGSASYNQKISEQRAKACYDYLITRGISSSRMSYVGYGEERPIATNDTAAGRETNRRVAFELFQ